MTRSFLDDLFFMNTIIIAHFSDSDIPPQTEMAGVNKFLRIYYAQAIELYEL